MGIVRLSAPIGAVLLLAACASNPYEAGFSFCDGEAGGCYRSCEELSETPEPYAACHARCEAAANQCFASVYESGRYQQSRTYAYSVYTPRPWYGRHGYWHPGRGYFFGFAYSDGVRYAPRYHGGYRYDDWYYGGYYRDRRRHPRGGAKQSPPSVSPPPHAAPPRADRPSSIPPQRRRNDVVQPYRPGPASPRTREDARNLEDH